MPFILSQIAPGSTYRPLARLTPRLASFPRPSAARWRAGSSADFSPWSRLLLSARSRTLCPQTRAAPLCRHREIHSSASRPYSVDTSASEPSPQALHDASSAIAVSDAVLDQDEQSEETLQETLQEQLHGAVPFKPQRSRRTRKRLRQSRPARLLETLNTSARSLYAINLPRKVDLSYARRHRYNRRNRRPRRNRVRLRSSAIPAPEPVSLYSILGRYLRHHATVQGEEFQFSQLELDLLQSNGFTPSSVERWGSSVMESNSTVAVEIFEPGREMPPLFLLLMFLRRKNMTVSALDIVMRHVNERRRSKPIRWSGLKILVVRLLRHARKLRSEWIPWVASTYAAEAARFYNPLSFKLSLDVTRYTNTLLSLLSLPTNNHPILSSSYQEKAQAQVLQFMASCSRPIVVSKLGFSSVTRTQLARAKTAREREWADLKGPSWPPWKEDRTAMDEEKGYLFGSSRASKILHRMFEAGYGARPAENMMQIYAGWDTDGSPTIQTRTSLPHFTSRHRDFKFPSSLLWASRIRATRSRREAWGCFLAQEATGVPATSHVYLAMFEKLHYQEVHHDDQSSLEDKLEQSKSEFSPGDVKEVFPDPSSPLHYIYLSEPVPSYTDLYRRMRNALVAPSNRLLAFLLETHPDFSMILDVIDQPKRFLSRPLSLLLTGVHDDEERIRRIPAYLFRAFIRFLCRFGHLEQYHYRKHGFVRPKLHAYMFRTHRGYLLDYAHSLLMHYKPFHRRAWSSYVNRLVQHRETGIVENISRNQVIRDLIDSMEEIGLDIDDDFFRIHCTATYQLAQAIYKQAVSVQESSSVLLDASSRLRKEFHILVGSNANIYRPATTQESQESPVTIPAYAPAPAVLHVYVRALGILRDFEGLYSFSTWLTQHHVEVSARVATHHGGSNMLFKTLVALRAAVEGNLAEPGQRAPADIAQLIEFQIESVEDWGGWPKQEDVNFYVTGRVRKIKPGVRR
ncbi:hypothetical protein IQ07DRAFT_575106 [Pyrenochaeta sp. DS3sAY3a]|nr:hypothetical protein IQ07DRAFT_575106 [Pyrenochaeta sp. DS3sAY3a]